MTAALRDHLPNDALGQVEEPGQVHGGDEDIILKRVVREGLADEHPGVVDQAVDPSEPTERLLHDISSGLNFGDVTSHREEVVPIGRADGA